MVVRSKNVKKKVQLRVSDVNQCLVKAQAYCAYQERHQQEVRDKIYSWGMHKRDVENIIAELISTDFINEERYAKTFAGGKFRIKKWGKVKIQIELKKRGISNYSMDKALQEIDEAEYKKTIKKVIAEKISKIKDINPLVRKHKTSQYAISRGFETDIVWGILNEM